MNKIPEKKWAKVYTFIEQNSNRNIVDRKSMTLLEGLDR